MPPLLKLPNKTDTQHLMILHQQQDIYNPLNISSSHETITIKNTTPLYIGIQTNQSHKSPNDTTATLYQHITRSIPKHNKKILSDTSNPHTRGKIKMILKHQKRIQSKAVSRDPNIKKLNASNIPPSLKTRTTILNNDIRKQQQHISEKNQKRK